MKKIVGILLAVMLCVMLGGCGTDPVQTDFLKYLNEDMKDVNANYVAITAESAKWSTFTKDEELIASAKEVLLPKINDSLEKLSTIQPETEEVKAVKEKYSKVMNTYKEGFEGILKAAETGDTAGLESANAKIQEGITYLNDYNKALEDLASQFDMEIEY